MKNISFFWDFLLDETMWLKRRLCLSPRRWLQPLKVMAASSLRMRREDKQRLFLAVGESFFSEDSDVPLGLSNEALWNDLSATFASLKAGLQVRVSSSVRSHSASPHPLEWPRGYLCLAQGRPSGKASILVSKVPFSLSTSVCNDLAATVPLPPQSCYPGEVPFFQ